jgi:para-nitrobenzyl esterase
MVWAKVMRLNRLSHQDSSNPTAFIRTRVGSASSLVESLIVEGIQGGCVEKSDCEFGFQKTVPPNSWLSLVFMVALLTAGAALAQDAPQVRTTAGQIRGLVRPGGGAKFLGIPYALPPVGDLRWREPVAAKPWSAVRDAIAFGAPCLQPDLGEWNRHEAQNGKEDCLYLNVVTPVWPAKEKLPVMFWIHGGANEGGTASAALYNDGTLPQHGVIVVSVNYRLGVFGFLAHPELTRESPHHASGNYGLMDQILALRWVRENIGRFGGDPGNITVFGQSAGSMDTGLLMTSPARGLFQRAIAESGAPFNPEQQTLDKAEQAGEKFAAGLNAPAGGEIAFLRAMSGPELLKRLTEHEPHPRFGPDIDGWVIAKSPAEVFALGQESPIPLLFGTTQREFGMEASPERLKAMIEGAAGVLAPRALAAYGLGAGGDAKTDPLYGTAADQFAADMAFRCPASMEGAWHTAAHHPVYEYEFDHAIPGQEAQGAVHSSDLPYVFGYFPKTGNIAGNFGDVDWKLADLMETYWTNFARSGNPNGAGLPDWPQFGSSQVFIQFAQDGHVADASRLRGAQCDVYRDFMAERMKQKP